MENVCLMALIVVDSIIIMMEIMMMIMNLVLETQNFVQSVCAKVCKISGSHATVLKKSSIREIAIWFDGLVKNEMQLIDSMNIHTLVAQGVMQGWPKRKNYRMLYYFFM